MDIIPANPPTGEAGAGIRLNKLKVLPLAREGGFDEGKDGRVNKTTKCIKYTAINT